MQPGLPQEGGVSTYTKHILFRLRAGILRCRVIGGCGLLALLVLLPASSRAQAFTQGTADISVFVGNGQAYAQNYTIVGLGLGYYVLDGLELGLAVEDWMNGDPHIYKVTPSLRLVFNTGTSINPYVGAFYRRVYTQGYPDLDAWGGRAGAFIATGARSYLGVGVVYTRIRDCNQAVYQTCSDTYPEFSLGFSL